MRRSYIWHEFRRGGYRPRALWTEKIFSQADARTSIAVTGPTSLNASHEKKREIEKREKERESEKGGREIEDEAERRRAEKVGERWDRRMSGLSE